MPKFPVDAPRAKVIKAFEFLGFQMVRKGAHIAMVRENPDGTRTPLTTASNTRFAATPKSPPSLPAKERGKRKVI